MNATRLLAETRHFDHTAKRYGTSWWGQATPAGQRRIQRRQGLARAFLARHRYRVVLEIGCGSGVLTQGLAEEASHWCAVDISSALLMLARRRGIPAQFARADAARLPFPSGAFDAVVGDGVLHHVELEPVLQEIRRVLVPGGGILFFEPNMANPQIFVERNTWVRWYHQTPEETAFYRWRIAPMVRRFWRSVHVEPFDFLHPLIPVPFVSAAEQVGRVLDQWPVVRELAGSLRIEAWGSP